MGDMADEYIDRIIYGGPQRPRSPAYGPPVSCNICGFTKVFWQAMPGGKFELRNTDDHQKHVCQTSADGFEEVPDVS